MYYENLFGIRYAVTDYKEACSLIIEKAITDQENTHFGVTASAVHGLIEGYWDSTLRSQINSIDLVVPDGQPIRWALNYFYNAKLKDRVYGPTLMLEVLKEANRLEIPIYLYGSTSETISKLSNFININFPLIKIAGIQSDRFRDSTPEEVKFDREKIKNSGARIVFVGRGCPRQEKWVAANKEHIPAVLIAVGAAFDFHAGNLKQAPKWMQNSGLEWLFRLAIEPGRLWKRYLTTNSIFIGLFLSSALKQIFKR